MKTSTIRRILWQGACAGLLILGAGPGALAAESTPPAVTQQTTPTVELYVTSWCPYCKQAEAYFRARGIPFTAYDIDADPAAAQRKRAFDSRGGVPFAVINGRGYRGFSEAMYDQALQTGQ